MKTPAAKGGSGIFSIGPYQFTQLHEGERTFSGKEEEEIMWSFMNQSGIPAAVLDFTNDLLPLLVVWSALSGCPRQ
jgi:hypothetical protein